MQETLFPHKSVSEDISFTMVNVFRVLKLVYDSIDVIFVTILKVLKENSPEVSLIDQTFTVFGWICFKNLKDFDDLVEFRPNYMIFDVLEYQRKLFFL